MTEERKAKLRAYKMKHALLKFAKTTPFNIDCIKNATSVMLKYGR